MITHLGANPRITNLICLDKTIEYSHEFGPHVKKILIQPRNFKDLRIAYTVGETFTNYLSLVSGSPYWEDNVIGPFTIYIKAEEDNVVAEIIEWESRD
jgi:hypothetical protein